MAVTTKICTTCEKRRNLTDFYKRKDAKVKYEVRSQCKFCYAEYAKRNRNHYRLRQLRLRRELKQELALSLGGKCKNCGYSKSVAALHFHHLEDKAECVARLIGNLRYNQAREEIKKCNLLCANCHAEETWRELSI